MAHETLISFTILGGILVIGFLGELLFRKYKISPMLILLAIGYVLGPGTGMVDIDLLRELQNLIGPLALMILLFDSGTRMNLRRLISESARGMGMGLLVGLLSIAFVAALWAYLFGDVVVGVLLGAVLAGTTGAMVNPVAEGIGLGEESKHFQSIESAITDVLSVVLVITITSGLISGALDVGGIISGVVNQFSTAAFLGAVAGILWIVVGTQMREVKFFHMLTFAVTLLFYVAVESVGASGAIGVLVFGIMLGNMAEIGRITGLTTITDDKEMLKFQDEISFMVRTFFFVFLGALVSIAGMDMVFLGIGILILLFFARKISVWAATMGSEMGKESRKLEILLPRGFGSAVLATYPMGMLVQYVSEHPEAISPERYAEIVGQISGFSDITFVVIVGSILVTTLGALNVTREDAMRKPRITYEKGEDLDKLVAAKAQQEKEKRAVKKRKSAEDFAVDMLDDSPAARGEGAESGGVGVEGGGGAGEKPAEAGEGGEHGGGGDTAKKAQKSGGKPPKKRGAGKGSGAKKGGAKKGAK
jgi:cell volume regulation protein A